MYRCCRGDCSRRGYDVQGVAGDTALGEDVMYRVLKGILRYCGTGFLWLNCIIHITKLTISAVERCRTEHDVKECQLLYLYQLANTL